MKIRTARVDDAKEISTLMCKTIRRVNSRDHTKRQLRVWLARNSFSIIKSRYSIKRASFVAVLNNKIAGVGTLYLKSRLLSALYIRYDLQGRGIGSKLLSFLEKYAKKNGITRLKLHSTKTAFEFYKSKGYRRVRGGNDIIKGVKIPIIIMTKKL
ncbi:MAG: GNAT family N-acetyltransferase [Candidatus Diapherotrites archaeon]|nr:GNAT family N-acetyltransferase [Candidatus Diapherotrites archaeon]